MASRRMGPPISTLEALSGWDEMGMGTEMSDAPPDVDIAQPFGHADLAEPRRHDCGIYLDCDRRSQESGHDGSPQIKKRLFIRPSYLGIVVVVVVFSQHFVPFRVLRYSLHSRVCRSKFQGGGGHITMDKPVLSRGTMLVQVHNVAASLLPETEWSRAPSSTPGSPTCTPMSSSLSIFPAMIMIHVCLSRTGLKGGRQSVRSLCLPLD
ncbi:hypothetical protein CH063_13824 [Colletotrichum higginsianum]|uniref:Uncharacterized protein n=1 Tax=Colletotrichum higginsianum (strain IMI 349063) TaxID=759273 RepID=H1VW01_COLHI|nr:hypothetical protein CH063_13824 [Colletotrichum higginsianum]